MEGTTSFSQFAAEIERRENAKADYILPTPKLSMVEDDALSFAPAKDAEPQRLPIADNHVHGQIASRLAIPKTFYDALPERAPGLRSEIVNRLFTAQPERRMVRTLDGKARAFLSDQFKPFDNMLAMNAVTPVLQGHKDLQIVASEITAKRLYLEVRFPKFEGEIRRGDAVQLGLAITNSEIGLSNLNVETLLWRLVCSNGAIGMSILKKRHAGSRIDTAEDDYSVFQADTLLVEMKSLQLRLRDLVAAALTDESFTKQLDGMKRAAGIEIVKPETVIENVTKRFQMPEGWAAQIQQNYFEAKDYTAFGVLNAVTALTHNTVKDDADRQYDVERIGGEIIALSPKDWEVMAEKAAA